MQVPGGPPQEDEVLYPVAVDVVRDTQPLRPRSIQVSTHIDRVAACARSGDAVMRCSLGASLVALATQAVRSRSPADASADSVDAHALLSQSAEHEPTEPSLFE